MAGNNGPSGAGTGGRSGGGRGGDSGSRTGGLGGGLSTGKTWHGNTAFGPSGGMARGYATASLGPGAGMGPSVNRYSNFRTPTGAPMVGGSLQGQPVAARNPQQALGMLQAMAAAAQGATVRPTAAGLLSDDDVITGPIEEAPIVAPPAPSWPWANPAVMNPYPQWSGAGSWFEGPNFLNVGPNPPRYTPGGALPYLKTDRMDSRNAAQSYGQRGDLPSNIPGSGRLR